MQMKVVKKKKSEITVSFLKIKKFEQEADGFIPRTLQFYS